MAIGSKFRGGSNSSNDDLYEKAWAELEAKDIQQGLWARLWAENDGDETKTKAAYLKERVKQLQESDKTAEAPPISPSTSQSSATSPPPLQVDTQGQDSSQDFARKKVAEDVNSSIDPLSADAGSSIFSERHGKFEVESTNLNTDDIFSEVRRQEADKKRRKIRAAVGVLLFLFVLSIMAVLVTYDGPHSDRLLDAAKQGAALAAILGVIYFLYVGLAAVLRAIRRGARSGFRKIVPPKDVTELESSDEKSVDQVNEGPDVESGDARAHLDGGLWRKAEPPFTPGSGKKPGNKDIGSFLWPFYLIGVVILIAVIASTIWDGPLPGSGSDGEPTAKQAKRVLKQSSMSVEDAVLQTVDDLREEMQLPLQMGDWEFYDVKAEGRSLVYEYRALSANVYGVAASEDQARKQVCSTRDMRFSLDLGITFVYRYYDSTGTVLGEVSVSSSDCSQ